MDYTIKKREEIKKMLSFLNYRECDHLFMNSVTMVDNKTYPSVNGKGEFFSNYFCSRSPLPEPTPAIVSYAHYQLYKECQVKLLSLAIRHKIPRFEQVLKKCYCLEFLPQ